MISPDKWKSPVFWATSGWCRRSFPQRFPILCSEKLKYSLHQVQIKSGHRFCTCAHQFLPHEYHSSDVTWYTVRVLEKLHMFPQRKIKRRRRGILIWINGIKLNLIILRNLINVTHIVVDSFPHVNLVLLSFIRFFCEPARNFHRQLDLIKQCLRTFFSSSSREKSLLRHLRNVTPGYRESFSLSSFLPIPIPA